MGEGGTCVPLGPGYRRLSAALLALVAVLAAGYLLLEILTGGSGRALFYLVYLALFFLLVFLVRRTSALLRKLRASKSVNIVLTLAVDVVLAIALVGGLLSIKPVISVERGEVVLLGKARGSKNGNNLLMGEIQKTAGIDFARPYRLGYTGLSDSLLQKYIADSRALWAEHADQLPICTVGGTIGTHVGPGAVAVAFFCKSAKH